jgi:hypothetical protein
MYLSRDSPRGKRIWERQETSTLSSVKCTFYKANERRRNMGNINLPFNSGDYSNSSPSLSKDGKTLCLAQHGCPVGQTDIWKVAKCRRNPWYTREHGNQNQYRKKNSFRKSRTITFFISLKRKYQPRRIRTFYMIDLKTNNQIQNVGKTSK